MVNTGEDIWMYGVFISPDIDTVLYLFSGDLDKNKWWGILDDTFHTHNHMKALGHAELLMLGDKDRAVNLLRTRLINTGQTLTEATAEIAKRFSIQARVIPMSDDPVTSRLLTSAGALHFQEFWVGQKGTPDVFSLEYEGIKKARLSPKARDVLEAEDCILIGPSNPMTSIGPILALAGMKDILKTKKVIAISPIIGKAPVSGPAGKLMAAAGLDVSSKSVAELYKEFVDVFIYDIRDDVNPNDIEAMGMKAVAFDTLMTDEEKRTALAKKCLDLC
jgi:LPPG:FO 2-phospho-L-lactate transferase